MAAHWERTKAANERKGNEATIREAMKLLLPDKQGNDFYLGAFWGLRYCMEIFDRCQARASGIVVPGKKQTNTMNQFRYSLQNMMGVAAVRAADSKKEKKC